MPDDEKMLSDQSQKPLKSEYFMEIYKIKLGDLSSLLNHYINAFAIATGINGALLKFALEQDASKQLRKGCIAFGVGFTLLGILACVSAELVRRAIAREIGELNNSLALPQPKSSILALQFSSVIVTIFATSCFIGWIYLWLH